MVVGNRMGEAPKLPWLRRWVNRTMSRIISRRAGRVLPDTQSGFRVIHLPTWSTLSLQTRRFEMESEMLMAFLAVGARVDFVPVQVIRSHRHSHIHPLTDSWRWLKWWKESGAVSSPGERTGTSGEPESVPVKNRATISPV
jgi:hypothetical protein